MQNTFFLNARFTKSSAFGLSLGSAVKNITVFFSLVFSTSVNMGPAGGALGALGVSGAVGALTAGVVGGVGLGALGAGWCHWNLVMPDGQ